MKCPSETCDYQTEDGQEMLTHLAAVHNEQKQAMKKDYAYEAQFYQNSKGKAQVICTAKADTIKEASELVIKLWNAVRDEATREGIELMEN